MTSNNRPEWGLTIPGRPTTPSEGRAQAYSRLGASESRELKAFGNGTTLEFGPDDLVDEFTADHPFFNQVAQIDTAIRDLQMARNSSVARQDDPYANFRDPQQSDNYKAEQEAVVYQAGGHSYVRVPSRFASVMNIFSVHNLRMNKGSWPGSRYEEMISTDSRFGVQAHVRPQGADNNNRQNYHEYQNRRVSAHRAGQGGGRGVPRGPSAASRGRNNRMHEGGRSNGFSQQYNADGNGHGSGNRYLNQGLESGDWEHHQNGFDVDRRYTNNQGPIASFQSRAQQEFAREMYESLGGWGTSPEEAAMRANANQFGHPNSVQYTYEQHGFSGARVQPLPQYPQAEPTFLHEPFPDFEQGLRYSASDNQMSPEYAAYLDQLNDASRGSNILLGDIMNTEAQTGSGPSSINVHPATPSRSMNVQGDVISPNDAGSGPRPINFRIWQHPRSLPVVSTQPIIQPVRMIANPPPPPEEPILRPLTASSSFADLTAAHGSYVGYTSAGRGFVPVPVLSEPEQVRGRSRFHGHFHGGDNKDITMSTPGSPGPDSDEDDEDLDLKRTKSWVGNGAGPWKVEEKGKN